MVSVITNDGKNNMLNCAFGGGEPFGFLAVGEGVTEPTAQSIALNSECDTDNGDYTRVVLETELDTDNFIMMCRGTLPTTNITNETTITEIGIVNSDTLGEGLFWCICEVDPIIKDSTKQIMFTIYSTMTECCPS